MRHQRAMFKYSVFLQRSNFFKAVLLQLLGLHVITQEIGFCNIRQATAYYVNDLRCSRHNYTDFRDTHLFDIRGKELDDTHSCYVSECNAPHSCMNRICAKNKTRECLDDCVYNHAPKKNQFYPFPPCQYLPSEVIDGYKIPSIYTLRISDELFNVNSSYNYILSGRGNITHCIEIEMTMDWCNDQANGRMYNGTYVLCREEKDLWRVMAEFGNRATHCIRYYIQKSFMKQKGSAQFKKDVHEICAAFETELHSNPELAKTHTTERHSVEVNTYNACCFLMKSRLIENFNCTGESTTRYPNTPAPTVEHELRIESELKVYDDSLLSTAITSKSLALCILFFVLFHKT